MNKTGVRRRGATYQAYWRDGSKQQQVGGFKTAAEATRFRAQQLADLGRGFAEIDEPDVMAPAGFSIETLVSDLKQRRAVLMDELRTIRDALEALA